MPYLIVDPCGQYPSHILEFLGGRLRKAGVAVFSTPARHLLWRDKWSRTLGRYVVDEYSAARTPSVDDLARRIASDWPSLEGIVPWDEDGVLLGAQLADRLGLDWNSVRVVERCRDKGVMKAWLRQHAPVRINAARVVTGAVEALAFQRELGRWPVVVKPTAGAGSENVFFPTSDEELLTRCQTVLESGDGNVLLEEFVGGDEYAINGIVDRAGDLLVTDVWLYDRRTSHGVPNIYHQAIKVSTDHALFRRLATYAAQVVESLELRRAPIHMEVKVDDRGPCLIEVGARLAGGNLPYLASKLHGRSLFELAACHWIGEIPGLVTDLDYERYDRLSCRLVTGVQRQEVRRIHTVHGLAEVERLPSFDSFGMIRPVGTPAPLTIDLDTRAYEVHLIHPDAGQVARDADVVQRLLRYA